MFKNNSLFNFSLYFLFIFATLLLALIKGLLDKKSFLILSLVLIIFFIFVLLIEQTEE